MQKEKLLRMVIISLITTLLVLSCGKNDDDEKEATETIEKISAKWDVPQPAEYLSLEFTEDGDYIIILPSNQTKSRKITSAGNSFLKHPVSKDVSLRSLEAASIVVGTYKVNEAKIELANYGTLDIINLTENEFSFKLTLKGSSSTQDYYTTKAATTIANSSRTKLLCKNWNIESVEWEPRDYDGDGYIDNDDEGTDLIGTTVFFSKYGTYLVIYPPQYYIEEGEDPFMLAYWKWKDSNENVLLYSDSNNEWGEDNGGEVDVVSLTENEMTFSEDGNTFHMKAIK